MLKFNIQNQTITRADNFCVVSDSKNYLKASFNFNSPDEWTGTITAVFDYGGKAYCVTLPEDSTCTVPWEVIKPPYFTVSVFCGDLVTADVVSVKVKRSGYKEGETPSEPTPDVYRQILDSVKPPYIGENSNWFVWNAEDKDFVDTGIRAEGEVGPQGEKGDPGDSVTIDPTLTTEGAAADAKAVGDKITEVTPVKGIDYWTEEDKAEIKAYVGDALGDIEISDIKNVIFLPTLYEGHAQFKGGWEQIVLADDITLEAGKSYLASIKLESAPDSSAYLQVKKQDRTNIVSAQLQGLTTHTEVITPLKTEENCIIHIMSASFTGKCYVTLIENGADNVTKASKQVEQLENGYKTFDGAFVYGNNYGNFDLTDKFKIVNVLPFKLDYNTMIRCDEGYEFMVLYVNENGKYLSDSGWVQYGDTHEVLANKPFRICIASKDTTATVDIEETKTKAQYTTKIASNLETEISKITSTFDTEIRKFNSDEFAIGERYNSFDSSVKTKITNVDSFTFDYDVSIKCSNGYRFLVLTYDENDKYKTYSGWKTADDVFTVPTNEPFRVSVEKETPENVTNIAEYVNAISYFTETGSNIVGLKNDMKTKLSNSNLFHIIKRNKYFSHIDVGYYNGLIIPSQSIFDVRRSKRLGFEMMELNVRKTSDGVFYAFHGSANCFGDAFQSVDGTDISAVNVSTVTSEYIQSNIRYKSRYAKYQVAPSLLRDVLTECKKNNIVPLLEYSDGVVEFAKSIMGDNLFLLGSYERDRSTLDCGDCVCVSWLTGTAKQIIAKAQKSGGAYVCGINVTAAMYADYTETDWTDFISEIHKAGYFVSCAYQSKAQTQMLLSAGIDIMASHGEINDIEHGNLFDAESNLDYADFTTNGTITDGVLSLSTGQYIEPNNITEKPFLGGCSLSVIFSGKIHVKMGSIDEDFESDGKKTLWFSSQTQQVNPTFLITAVNDTEILEVSFKASKM